MATAEEFRRVIIEERAQRHEAVLVIAKLVNANNFADRRTAIKRIDDQHIWPLALRWLSRKLESPTDEVKATFAKILRASQCNHP